MSLIKTVQIQCTRTLDQQNKPRDLITAKRKLERRLVLKEITKNVIFRQIFSAMRHK